MVGFVPKAIAVVGAGVLCFGMLCAYDFVGIGGPNSPSPTLLWLTLGVGFAMAGCGLTAAAQQLPRGRRKTLSVCLSLFGVTTLVLAMFVAHVGPLLLVLAVPAIIFGVIVGIMAIPFSRLARSKQIDKVI